MDDLASNGLLVRQEDPPNAESPVARLTGDFITPTPLFFVRSHAPAPDVDPVRYRLRVEGLVEKELELSLDDLLSDFQLTDVTATLQCAGNRRDELVRVRDIPGEIPWGAGAIGTARWRGVRLAAVLAAAGVGDDAAHVELTGLDRITGKGETDRFGGSIPLEKARAPEVLLAHEMNGEPLSRDHGGPLRALVPGYIGARSVKWLGRITVRDRPSDNHFQAGSYRLFPPDVRPEDADPIRGIPLGELPVNAVVTEPGEGAILEPGPVRVRGYAVVGGGRTVERVRVSPDGGGTWVDAGMDGHEEGRWAWRLWEADLGNLAPGQHELVARAWDSAGASQPERVASIWNLGGYANNAWHRRSVRVRGG